MRLNSHSIGSWIYPIPFYSCPVCVQKFFTHRYNDVPVSVGASSTQYKTSLGKHVSTSPTTVLTLVLRYVSSLLAATLSKILHG